MKSKEPYCRGNCEPPSLNRDNKGWAVCCGGGKRGGCQGPGLDKISQIDQRAGKSSGGDPRNPRPSSNPVVACSSDSAGLRTRQHGCRSSFEGIPIPRSRCPRDRAGSPWAGRQERSGRSRTCPLRRRERTPPRH